MRRLALVVACTATGLLSLATALSPAAAAPSPLEDSAFRAVPKQNLKWVPCTAPAIKKDPRFKALECARLKSPMDWNKPNGKAIVIQVTRLKARSGNPKGVVFTNPGGPGGAGWSLPLSFIVTGQNRLLDNMDVIGIDVRGTGYSTQTKCNTAYGPGGVLDPRNRSKANTAKLLAVSKAFAKACNNNGGKKFIPTKLVTTAQTVYDLEWLRMNLKDSKGAPVKKINWIGYSGGTWLGAHYARRWPKATGNFVLDSNVDFTASWQSIFNRQPKGFQRRFTQDFTPWAAKFNGDYKLGTTGKAVYGRYEAVRKFIAKHGRVRLIDQDDKSTIIYPVDVDNYVAQNLYSKGAFPDIAGFLGALNNAFFRGNGRLQHDAKFTYKPLQSIAQAEDATFRAITCNDTKYGWSPKTLAAKSAAAGKQWPLIGFAKIQDPCVYWKRAKVSKKMTLRRPVGSGPRLLMVQSRNDPATPWEGAAAAHRKYKNSRMVLVENEGDHAIYGAYNGCVDTIVDNYIVDGVWPDKDQVCQGIGLPNPQGADQRGVSGERINPVLYAEELARM
ncbi:alpha/beta hydrolase [Actinocorallia lasiicapitis]